MEEMQELLWVPGDCGILMSTPSALAYRSASRTTISAKLHRMLLHSASKVRGL